MINPVKYEEIPLQGKHANKLKKEIESFLETNEKYGEVELDKRVAASVASSIKTYIRRYNYPLRVMQKSNRVFVIRTDADE